MAANLRSLFRPGNLARIEARLQLIEGDVDLLDAMFFVEDAEGRRMSYGETNQMELQGGERAAAEQALFEWLGVEYADAHG